VIKIIFSIMMRSLFQVLVVPPAFEFQIMSQTGGGAKHAPQQAA